MLSETLKTYLLKISYTRTVDRGYIIVQIDVKIPFNYTSRMTSIFNSLRLQLYVLYMLYREDGWDREYIRDHFKCSEPNLSGKRHILSEETSFT